MGFKPDLNDQLVSFSALTLLVWSFSTPTQTPLHIARQSYLYLYLVIQSRFSAGYGPAYFLPYLLQVSWSICLHTHGATCSTKE